MNSIIYILNYLSIQEYGIVDSSDLRVGSEGIVNRVGSEGIVNHRNIDISDYYYFLKYKKDFDIIIGNNPDRNTLFKNILYIQESQ